MKKIAINGMGRTGRLMLRRVLSGAAPHIEVVAVNDVAAPDDIAYLLKYDSVHGRLNAPVRVEAGNCASAIDRYACCVKRIRVRCLGAISAWRSSSRPRDNSPSGRRRSTPRSRRTPGADRRSVAGRGRDARPGRQRSGVRFAQTLRRVERVVHDELARATAQSAAGSVRRRGRDGDDGPRIHGLASRRRQAREENAPRPCSRSLDDPDLDGRRCGNGAGIARVEEQDPRGRDSRPGARRLGHGHHGATRTRRNARGRKAALRDAANGPMKGILGYTEEGSYPSTSSASRCRGSSMRMPPRSSGASHEFSSGTTTRLATVPGVSTWSADRISESNHRRR